MTSRVRGRVGGERAQRSSVFASFVSWRHTLRGTQINWCASPRKSGCRGHEAGAWEGGRGEHALQAPPAGAGAPGAGGWCGGLLGQFLAQQGGLPSGEGSRDDTDEGGRLQAIVWASAEQTWAPGKREAGCCLRFLPAEILRSQAGPGVETGAGLMTPLQPPLAPGFPFWPVVLGHPLSRL